MHGLEQGTGAGVADGLPLIGRPSAYLLFDGIELRDVLYSFGCDRRTLRFHQVVELAADVGHAGSFEDGTVFVELVEAGIGIGLQNALVVLQVPLRMLSLAIGRVGEPCGGSVLRSGRPIVANVSP